MRQLGNDAPAAQSSVPVKVVGLVGTVERVSGGHDHTCALLTGGDVQCWGRSTGSQLGYATPGADYCPKANKEVDGVLKLGAKAVVTGDRHTCVLLENDTVSCWGYNANGQLGDPTVTGQTLVPTPVNLGSAVVLSVMAGYRDTCALLEGGAINCWGLNDFGRLGIGNTTAQPSPVSVDLPGKVNHLVSEAVHHTCALFEDGLVRCWGFNDYGQLGVLDIPNNKGDEPNEMGDNLDPVSL